jgi:hypothetical protein
MDQWPVSCIAEGCECQRPRRPDPDRPTLETHRHRTRRGDWPRPHGDLSAARWIGIRHAEGHIHLVATLARQDRRAVWLWQDYRSSQARCRDMEQHYGLHRVGGRRTGGRHPTPAELNKTTRQRRDEVPETASGAWSTLPPETLSGTADPPSPPTSACPSCAAAGGHHDPRPARRTPPPPVCVPRPAKAPLHSRHRQRVRRDCECRGPVRVYTDRLLRPCRARRRAQPEHRHRRTNGTRGSGQPASRTVPSPRHTEPAQRRTRTRPHNTRVTTDDPDTTITRASHALANLDNAISRIRRRLGPSRSTESAP